MTSFHTFAHHTNLILALIKLCVCVCVHTHLVVDLELSQCGVELQRLDERQDSGSSDEVGLNVEALQRRVDLQHLGQSLRRSQEEVREVREVR